MVRSIRHHGLIIPLLLALIAVLAFKPPTLGALWSLNSANILVAQVGAEASPGPLQPTASSSPTRAQLQRASSLLTGGSVLLENGAESGSGPALSIYRSAGRVALMLGSWDEARTWLARAAADNATDSLTSAYLGQLDYLTGDIVGSAANWRAAGALPYLSAAADRAMAEDRWTDTATFADAARQLDPYDVVSVRALSFSLYYGSHDAGSALALLRAAIINSGARDDGKLAWYTAAGDIYEGERRFDEALALYDEGIARLGATGYPLVVRLAKLCSTYGDDQATAETLFNRAIALAPDREDAYTGMGQLDLRLGRYEEASQRFEHAHLLNPQSPWPLLGAMQTYVLMGNMDGARATFDALRAQTPDFAPAYYQLGLAYLGAADPAHARSALEKAVQLAPTEPGYHDKLAEAYLLLGLPNLAAGEYRAIVALAPGGQVEDRAAGWLRLHSEGQ